MVDAAAAEAIGARKQGRGTEVGASNGSVQTWSEAAARDYRDFVEGLVSGAPQHPDWIDAWQERQNAEVFVLWFTDQTGQRRGALPLEVVHENGFAIARIPGGRHACGSFPAFQGEGMMPDTGSLRRVFRDLRPEIDVLLVERLSPTLAGHDNPLANLANGRSPNVALSVDLQPGFEAILQRVGRKRRMKRHRGQIRKMEAVGSYRRFQAGTDEEVDRLLGAFLEMKAERFQKFGIRNVFVGVETFWADLFKRSLREEKPSFVLHALEVAGKLRAVTGSSNIADRQICEFGAIVEDELIQASPGDHLAFENIKEAAAAGHAVYDFSIGDEHYKRQWCDIETEFLDAIVPLTLKGRGYAAVWRASSEAKRRIKANDGLWSVIKRLRRRRGGAEPTAARQDDED